MPAFDITVQGKIHHVELPDPRVTPLVVIVDGQSFEVSISGTEFQVEAQRIGQTRRRATEPPVLSSVARVPVAHSAAQSRADGSNEIVAPMPGTILSVEVSLGQQVDSGDVLCVLEAMKMRNPIRAGYAGSVTEIAAEAGRSVSQGEVLLRLA